jgi:hypothetical protein
MKPKHLLLLGLIFLLMIAAFASVMVVQAGALTQSATPTPSASTIHPQFAFLDEQGQNVLDNNQPVSTMKTCG